MLFCNGVFRKKRGKYDKDKGKEVGRNDGMDKGTKARERGMKILNK